MIVMALLLTVIWWVLATSHPANPPRLSVVFVEFTNNPVHTMQPVRVEVPQGAKGLCALFQVSNADPNQIQFDTLAVDTNNGSSWARFAPVTPWRGIEGSLWLGGYSCLYAVAWPPGLPTNIAWRLELSVAKELTGLRADANELVGRKLFRPMGRVTTLSSEVRQ